MDGLTVKHAVERRRYELWEGDQLIGFADASPMDGAVAMPHVEISPEFRGRGYGTRLVQAALDDLRQVGQRVLPLCPFVLAFLRSHPEYRDLQTGVP